MQCLITWFAQACTLTGIAVETRLTGGCAAESDDYSCEATGNGHGVGLAAALVHSWVS